MAATTEPERAVSAPARRVSAPLPPALAVRGLRVTFGSGSDVTVAVDDVSLTVAVGEVVALVGPSGSGKSTLLRAVAGLEPVAAGEIEVAGRSMADVPVFERQLGLMFQDHALFPHLSVAANIAFGLKTARARRWSKPQQRQRVDELLSLTGLSALRHRRVDELSGGEAQRVALARSLAPQPGLLLLDEPFGSLDPILRQDLIGEWRDVLHQLGQSAVHVTHDLDEAYALADRVALIRGGQTQQVAEPEVLWKRPANRFVAEFVGHHNIWTVTEGAVDQSPPPATAVDPTSGGGPDPASGSVDADLRLVAVPSQAITVSASDPAIPASDSAIPASDSANSGTGSASDPAIPASDLASSGTGSASDSASSPAGSAGIGIEADVTSSRWSRGRYVIVAVPVASTERFGAVDWGSRPIVAESERAWATGSRVCLTINPDAFLPIGNPDAFLPIGEAAAPEAASVTE